MPGDYNLSRYGLLPTYVLSTIPKLIGGNGFAEGFKHSTDEKGGNKE